MFLTSFNVFVFGCVVYILCVNALKLLSGVFGYKA